MTGVSRGDHFSLRGIYRGEREVRREGGGVTAEPSQLVLDDGRVPRVD